MSTAVVPRPPACALERVAWAGLIAGLLLVASAGCLAALPRPAAYATFGPKDLLDWSQAIAGAVGTLAAALNGLAIIWHRWGKPPRRPRRKDTPPPPATGGPTGSAVADGPRAAGRGGG